MAQPLPVAPEASQRFVGTGPGLAITRVLVEQPESCIWAERGKLAESVFDVELPAVAGAPPGQPVRRNARAPSVKDEPAAAALGATGHQGNA